METMHQTPYALPLCGELVAEGLQLRYYATTSFDGEDDYSLLLLTSTTHSYSYS